MAYKQVDIDKVIDQSSSSFLSEKRKGKKRKPGILYFKIINSH